MSMKNRDIYEYFHTNKLDVTVENAVSFAGDKADGRNEGNLLERICYSVSRHKCIHLYTRGSYTDMRWSEINL